MNQPHRTQRTIQSFDRARGSAASEGAARDSLRDDARKFRESGERYRTLVESMDAGFCVIEMLFDGDEKPIDYRFVEINPAFERQTGLVDAIGRTMREMVPEHEQHWFDIYGRVALTGEPERFENGAAGLGRWYEVYAFRVGEPHERHVAVLFNDIMARVRVEARLRASELRYRTAARVGRFGSWETDFTTGIRHWTSEGMELFGLALPGGKGQVGGDADEWRAALHPDEAGFPAHFYGSIESQNQVSVEYRIVRDGQVVWLHGYGEVVGRDAAGKPTRIVNVAADITKRKSAEEHRELLIHELNHRVKNTLATVQSIAMQTFRGSERNADARELFESRLGALSRAHDVLTQHNWDGASLRDVVTRALEPFRGTAERISIEGPEVRLSPKQTMALAMALHELATNALKYGALANDDGRVAVSWKVLFDNENRKLDLTWTEQGGPPVSPPTRKGFGSRLLERALASELDGEAHLDYLVDGVVARITASVEPSVEGAVTASRK